MTKKNKTVIAVLSVILVIGIVFAVFTSLDGKVIGADKLKDNMAFSSVSDYPIVQSSEKNIFYELHPDGKVSFSKLDGVELRDVSDVKTVSTKLDMSYQSVPVKIYYIETENGIVGYGLFNSEQKSDVKLLSYVFVRLMETPPAFKKAAGTKYVLLADTNPEDAYKTDKTYSEMFSFNLSSGKAERIISQRDRTVQKDGTVNEGWTIFTDSSVNCLKKNDLFASNRIHDFQAEEKLYCIMNVANSTSMKKTTAYKVQNSPSYEIREKDGAWYCFNSTDTGFDLIKNGDKKKPLKSFEGSFNDYCVSGDWIFNKLNCEFTNIYTGETKTVNGVSLEGFAGFTANGEGTKFVIVVNGEKSQSIICCDTENDSQKILRNEDYNGALLNFCFTDSNRVMVTNYTESKSAENIFFEF